MADLTLFAFDPQTNVFQSVSAEDRAVCSGALSTPGLTRFQYLTGPSQSLATSIPEDTAIGSLFQVTAYASGHPKFIAIWECSDISATLPSGAIPGDITGAASGSLYIEREAPDFWKFDYIGEGSIDHSTADISSLRTDLADGQEFSGKGTEIISYNGFLLVKRPLKEKLREGISFCDNGAVGNEVTDDWESMQELVNEVGLAGGGQIQMPHGKHFRITQPLEIQYPGISIIGAGSMSDTVPIPNTASEGVVGEGRHSGSSRLVGDFDGGPVIRVLERWVRLADFTVDSSDDRRLSAYSDIYAGVRVEAPDIDGRVSQRFLAERLRVTNQPGCGYILINSCEASRLDFCEADNNRGHGFRLAGGVASGRTHRGRNGQIQLNNTRCFRNGGHSICVGGDDVDDLDVLYRIEIYNADNGYNAITPDICYRDVEHNMYSNGYISGEQILVVASAFSGQTQYPTQHLTHLPVIIRGAGVKFDHHRFINGLTYAAVIEGHPREFWQGKSHDIQILGAYVSNSLEGAGYYAPAFYYGDDVQGVNITTGGRQPVVGTLSSRKPGTRFREEFNGVVTEELRRVNKYKEVSDSIVTESIRAGYLRSFSGVSLDNDQAGYIEFDGVAQVTGSMDLNGSLSAAGGAKLRFRVGDANAFCTVESSSGATFTTGIGTLVSGTSGGVDGNFNVFVDTATRRIYLKNRLGAARGYAITFTSVAGTNAVGEFVAV